MGRSAERFGGESKATGILGEWGNHAEGKEAMPYLATVPRLGSEYATTSSSPGALYLAEPTKNPSVWRGSA